MTSKYGSSISFDDFEVSTLSNNEIKGCDAIYVFTYFCFNYASDLKSDMSLGKSDEAGDSLSLYAVRDSTSS